MKKKHVITLPILATLLLLAGCDQSTSVSATTGSTVTGRMEGDGATAKRSAGSVQSLVVTAFAINADGSLGAQVGKDTTDAQGNFQIKTPLQGSQNWVLMTTQGTMHWMTRFNDTLSGDQLDTARPINMESTLLTQVYLNLQKTDAGKTVTSGEVTSAIDLSVTTSTHLQYENDDSLTRITVISHLTAIVIAQSQARNAYLSKADAQFATDTSSAAALTRRAEKNLNFALYDADEDTARASLAEKTYLKTVIAAYGKSDSIALAYARSNEAAYHATLLATVLYVDSTKASMRRRLLHVMAIASDTAIQRELNTSSASTFQLQTAVTAGAAFLTAVDTSRTDVSRDSITSAYRTAIRSIFKSQGALSDSSFIAMLNLVTTPPLSVTLHTLAQSLQTSLLNDMSSLNASQMGLDLENDHGVAINDILQAWQGNPHNANVTLRNSAMAQIMAFLSVSSNSSHNGT
jgi:hypothetical protein